MDGCFGRVQPSRLTLSHGHQACASLGSWNPAGKVIPSELQGLSTQAGEARAGPGLAPAWGETGQGCFRTHERGRTPLKIKGEGAG